VVQVRSKRSREDVGQLTRSLSSRLLQVSCLGCDQTIIYGVVDGLQLLNRGLPEGVEILGCQEWLSSYYPRVLSRVLFDPLRIVNSGPIADGTTVYRLRVKRSGGTQMGSASLLKKFGTRTINTRKCWSFRVTSELSSPDHFISSPQSESGFISNTVILASPQ
jgi:hypothetical protein